MANETHGKQRAEDWDAFSRNYHADSVTPFARGVRFRLRKDLRRLVAEWRSAKARRSRVFVDFGCGPGDALELVAGNVPLSAGVDFAPKMLRMAATRLRGHGVKAEVCRSTDGFRRIRDAGDAVGQGVGESQTLLVEADLRKLRAIRGCVDAATSINSICASNGRDASWMFGEMARSLRTGGRFFSVWPAVESLEYLFELDRSAGDAPGDRGEILRSDGVHVDATGYALKLFRAEEIRGLCDLAGLVVDVLAPVRYPWAYMRELGWGYYPNRRCLWDWYLIARATNSVRRRSRASS